MSVVGTVDDRVMLGPLSRLAVEIAVAVALWAEGLGWSAFNSDVAGLALTIVWIVGLVNAFNLMDNLDGAAGTVGMVCAAGAGAVALDHFHAALAAVALALSGACAGFLLYNLRRPARIFLGDGGSMPIGFVVAAVLMAVAHNVNGLGAAAVVAAAPLAGLVILDTTLVMVSRLGRGAPLLSGARDHLTHRMLGVLGTPQRISPALAFAQAALCTLGFVLLRADTVTVVAVGMGYIALGAAVIMLLDRQAQAEPSLARQESTP
jgi:UDP-GlcNAc:undecaprenyl-phosphate GlcNAc-1-phosphate transferase